jgi:hypothetical protein
VKKTMTTHKFRTLGKSETTELIGGCVFTNKQNEISYISSDGTIVLRTGFKAIKTLNYIDIVRSA